MRVNCMHFFVYSLMKGARAKPQTSGLVPSRRSYTNNGNSSDDVSWEVEVRVLGSSGNGHAASADALACLQM